MDENIKEFGLVLVAVIVGMVVYGFVSKYIPTSL
jgi:hypothetical protein